MLRALLRQLGGAKMPAAPDPALQRLQAWMARDEFPAYDLEELRANPARLHAALMLAGIAREEGPQQPGAPSRVDRLLRAEQQLRHDPRDAETQFEALAQGEDRYAARASALLGRRLFDRGEFARAQAFGERALHLGPPSAAAHDLLALLCEWRGETGAAGMHLEQGLALRPDSLLLLGSQAGHLMAQGRLAEGLAVFGRSEEVSGALRDTVLCPPWHGEPLGGGSLLIVCGYGFGDMIQLMRFVPDLRAREPHARISLLVPLPLARTAQATGWFDEVLTAAPDLARFDWQVTQTQMVRALGLTMQNLRPEQSYLQVEAAHIAQSASWLPARPEGMRRVGLRWQGSAQAFDAKRSIPASLLGKLLDRPGIEWVALSEDRSITAQLPGRAIDPGAYLRDFQDTAALMQHLDLVISVDTSVAHLAAASGRPTWLLARPDAEWRWGRPGEASPWYADVRIFRHPAGQFDWPAVLSQVAQALRAAPA
jgi:ADP-heptose:LPS heptosyltransferase